MGQHAIEVRDVRDVTIHASQFYDLVYAMAGDDQQHTCRLGPEAVEGRPASGDRLVADFAMGQITRAKRA